MCVGGLVMRMLGFHGDGPEMLTRPHAELEQVNSGCSLETGLSYMNSSACRSLWFQLGSSHESGIYPSLNTSTSAQPEMNFASHSGPSYMLHGSNSGIVTEQFGIATGQLAAVSPHCEICVPVRFSKNVMLNLHIPFLTIHFNKS